MNIFAPLQWLGRTAVGGIQAAGRGIGKGVHQIEQLPQRLGAKPDEQMMRTLGFNPEAALPPFRSTAGAGKLGEAAGIPLESRAGNFASALGMPDTGGGVLMGGRSEPAPGAPYLTRNPDIAGRGLTRGEAAAVREPEVAGLNFGVSPNQQVTPVDPVSAKLFRRDVARPFDPQADPLEANRRSAIVNRYEKVLEPGGRRKLALQNAGLGALMGISKAYAANPRADWRELLGAGAGGGAVAGIGSAINPEMGTKFQVDQTVTPELMRDEERGLQLEDRANKRRQLGLQEQNIQSQMDDRLMDNLYRREALKRQQNRDDYQRSQDSWENAYKQREQDLRTRELDIKEQNDYFTRRKTAAELGQLNGADETTLRHQAEAMAISAFDPVQSRDLQQRYADEAYKRRTKNGVPMLFSGPNAVVDTVADRRLRAESEKEGQATYDREMKRWTQLFHDELRARAEKQKRGESIPEPGPVTPAQIEAVAKVKRIKPEDAKILLQTLGYEVLDQ